MQPTKEEIKAWVDVPERGREWLAAQCGISSERTVSNWLTSKSVEVPSKALRIIEKLMEADAKEESAKEAKPDQQLSHLTLRITTDDLNDWAAAYKESAFSKLEDWTIAAVKEFIRLEREAEDLAEKPKLPAVMAGTGDAAADDEKVIEMPTRWIDLLGGVAAGERIDAVSEEPIPVEKEYPSDHYALRVFGESMAPKIPDGSTIIVRRPAKPGFPKKGTIVVYSDGTGSTLKEFGYRKAKEGEEGNSFGDVPVLRSLNPLFKEVQTMEGGKIDAHFVEVL